MPADSLIEPCPTTGEPGSHRDPASVREARKVLTNLDDSVVLQAEQKAVIVIVHLDHDLAGPGGARGPQRVFGHTEQRDAALKGRLVLEPVVDLGRHPVIGAQRVE
jgi:hypothetical protein